MLPLPSYVIFLDIDGVMLSEDTKRHADNSPAPGSRDYLQKQEGYLQKDKNSYSNNYWTIYYAYHFSRMALSSLDELIKRVETVATPQIVVTSRWREGRTVEELKTHYFSMHNFAKYIIDKTPDHRNPYRRGEEIRAWLDVHPEVDHYTIFDDCDYGLSDLFKRRFVQVDSYNLLTPANINEALAADPLTAHLFL